MTFILQPLLCGSATTALSAVRVIVISRRRYQPCKTCFPISVFGVWSYTWSKLKGLAWKSILAYNLMSCAIPARGHLHIAYCSYSFTFVNLENIWLRVSDHSWEKQCAAIYWWKIIIMMNQNLLKWNNFYTYINLESYTIFKIIITFVLKNGWTMCAACSSH